MALVVSLYLPTWPTDRVAIYGIVARDIMIPDLHIDTIKGGARLCDRKRGRPPMLLLNVTA